MSDTEMPITDAPQAQAIDPAVAEILRLFRDRVESITLTNTVGDLTASTHIALSLSDPRH